MSVGGLKVTFLGTGTSMGVPVIACPCEVCKSQDPRDNRLRSSILVQKGDVNIIVDSGPDFRYQVLRSGIKHLDALVFTHEHKDHTAGMDDVRAFNFFQRQSMDIYASNNVEEAIRRDFHYAFADTKYPGVPELTIHKISEKEDFQIKGLKWIPILVMHHKLPVLGFRIEDFVYITDANDIPESEWSKLEGCKVLVLNALRKTTHISHFTLEEAVAIAERVGAERAYLTHISHQMGTHEVVSKELPPNVFIAEDQMVLEL